ncbi:unnamed protein product [Schistosoma mattheei]|uniref:Uncharacterized protein n=1 Tax=Schistosoma mattheei TaxID=31246 RepID=A0A3P7Y6T8_9TREM|nr:unnamed protein product [Schistosoma mattheei]
MCPNSGGDQLLKIHHRMISAMDNSNSHPNFAGGQATILGSDNRSC